jgi:hypothetical protein
MSREQIEEMRKDLIEIFDEEYEKRRLITPNFTAEKMTDKGYRKQEWISVDERLPSKSGKYICCTTKGTILIERFYELDDGGWFSNHNFCNVTHWMALPELPKMKGGD